MSEQHEVEELETDEIPAEEPESEAESPEAGSDAPEETDEDVITIGDEPEEEEQAPDWVKDLRKTHREQAKRLRELEKENETLKNGTKQKETLGPKPRLEDFDDGEDFEAALDGWFESKRRIEDAERQEQAEQNKVAQEWQNTLNEYEQKKAALNVADYEDAEDTAMGLLNQMQQGIIVQGSDNAAVVMYAIGKNPARAQELASITDPVRFAVAIGKLEKDLKVNKRKAPAPETRVSNGTAPKSGAVDSTLDKLREKAEKTGDYSEVLKYKRDKR